MATAALTFDTFEKRITWLLFSVNAQLVTAEYFAFEGETVNSWQLDRLGLIAMLDALYAPLAKQAKKAAGRTEIERRYGMRAAAAIGHLLMRIEAERRSLQFGAGGKLGTPRNAGRDSAPRTRDVDATVAGDDHGRWRYRRLPGRRALRLVEPLILHQVVHAPNGPPHHVDFLHRLGSFDIRLGTSS